LVGMMPMMVQGQICKQQERSNNEGHSARLPPGDDPQNEPNDRKRSLHGSSALVRRFPLSEQRTVVQLEARRLFGNVNVECCAREDSGDRKIEVSSEHILAPVQRRLCRFLW
jgi:hypothetical protein